MKLTRIFFFVLAAFLLEACSDNGIELPLLNKSDQPNDQLPDTQSQADPVITSTEPAPSKERHTPAKGIEAELLATHKPRNDIERARNSTVFIDTGFGHGSGFFIDDTCMVVTNKHVVRLSIDDIKKMKVRKATVDAYLEHGVPDREKRQQFHEEQDFLDKALDSVRPSGKAKRVIVTLVNGRESLAKIITTSDTKDLAYLYVREAGCVPLNPVLEDNLPLGQKVYTIGNPSKMKYSVTSGIISGYHKFDSPEDNVEYIQTDAAINGGNSGGPLIDSNGNLLGVNTMKMSNAEGLGFAIPAKTLIDDLESKKKEINKILKSPTYVNWISATSSNMTEEDRAALDKQIEEAAKNCDDEFEEQQWTIAIEECQFAADYGDANSQYLLSRLYYEAHDEIREELAIRVLTEAAHNKSPEALWLLGYYRSKGDYVKKNSGMALELFKEGCEVNFHKACNFLAHSYLDNLNYDKAHHFLNKSIELGSIAALHNLGYMYHTGLGVDKDEAKAFEYIERAAMLGFKYSQFSMAFKFYDGLNASKNYKTAYKWLVVSEINEEDSFENWVDDVPSNFRLHLYKLLSDHEKEIQQKLAKALVEEIAINRTSHIQKFKQLVRGTPSLEKPKEDKNASTESNNS